VKGTGEKGKEGTVNRSCPGERRPDLNLVHEGKEGPEKGYRFEEEESKKGRQDFIVICGKE